MPHRIINTAEDLADFARLANSLAKPFTVEWHPIPGYEGRYEITREGRVRRLPRLVNAPQNGGHRFIGFRELKLQSIKGYPGFIGTDDAGRKTSVYVHRILATLFVPNPDGKPNVNHIDGDKTNFSLCNLEWVTHGENMRHGFRTGLIPLPKSGPGEESPAAKLDWQRVGQIREMLASGHRHIEIARQFGVGKGAIGCISRNETWRVEQ